MNDKDRLFYEKANNYRLHADNLKWTLLGGYAAFYVAVISQLKDISVTPNLQTAILFFLLFLVSLFYLFLLAVQSWYYNLFGAYVEDCEIRFAKRKPLISLVEFSALVRHNISPLHPAFSFALFIVAITSMGFLLPVARYLATTYLPLQYQQQEALLGFAVCGYFVYVIVFSLLFRNWDKFTYPWLIRPMSNLRFKKLEDNNQ